MTPSGPAPAGEDSAAGVRPDGAWVDFADQQPFGLDGAATPEHLRRVLRLAQAARSTDGEDADALRRSFDYWLSRDFQSVDWRQNQLVVPRLVGSVALLMDDRLSAGARGKVTEILARSRWEHWIEGSGWADWTGIPLLRIARNVILRGCVCDSPNLFEEAFARAFGAIRVVGDDDEGIQPDMLYQSSRDEPSSGHDGLVYATECTRFIALAHGTQWQAPVPAMQLLTDFLLDGQQWLMRNGVIDSNFPARNIQRATGTVAELAAAVGRLAQLGNTPRQGELSSLARRLSGLGETLGGHRHFWRAGFSVHQRPAFYASVCLPGKRSVPAALGAPEGMTCVMSSGREYDGISAILAADGLPGTTFLRGGTILPKEPPPVEAASVAGGVSEGDYGLAAMRTESHGLSATKAWFYFDQSVVCLGAGISAPGASQPVFTAVNHCRLHGSVLAAADLAQPRTLVPGTEYALPMIRRVLHDGVVYYFSKPSRVAVQIGVPPSTVPVDPPLPERFALLLNHGLRPQNEAYNYIIVPVGEDASAKAKTDEEVAQIEILANTPAVQAVRHRSLKLLGVVFWQAGMVALPGAGRVAANQPCVLLCRETASSGKRLTIANIRNEPTTVHIEYASRCLCFELPGGVDARRGVSRSL